MRQAIFDRAGGQFSLLPMLHEGVHIDEDTARGLGPAFTPDGFHKPDKTQLVRGGRLGRLLRDVGERAR